MNWRALCERLAADLPAKPSFVRGVAPSKFDG